MSQTIYLLDTSTFSDLMREDPRVAAELALARLADARVCICSIVRGEIAYGLERLPQSRRRQTLAAKANHLFAALPCESIPERAADHYARIKRHAQRKGRFLDENDLWIAATALALNATLVTSDSDHQRVSGLDHGKLGSIIGTPIQYPAAFPSMRRSAAPYKYRVFGSIQIECALPCRLPTIVWPIKRNFSAASGNSPRPSKRASSGNH